jgi:cytosine/adenosine deaminase-related metal-dependent hydrolase
VGEILIRDIYHLVTQDDAGQRLAGADVLVRDGRIAALGRDLQRTHPPVPGVTREILRADRCVVLPGLINTHHHLYQTFTRNLPAAQDQKLFDWLRTLYEVWRHVDPEVVYWSTLLGGAELLLTGCTTTSDHHYVFPRDAPAELLDAQFEAAARLGIRMHATRGSMSLGRSAGGLPPDDVVQDEDVILADCERVIDRWHDPQPFAMQRVALAPCSPFSITEQLLRATIQLARRRGVHCHTHLAETADENRFCVERYGRRPLQWMADLEWLGPDVWFAHGIHFSDAELDLLARTRTGIAHCPASNMRLASGIPRVPEMLRRGVPVGLGVDGSASNDASNMLGEVRQALLLARVGFGADALSASAALRLATRGSATLLGRSAELGSIEVGKAADLVLVDVSGLDRAGALADPLAALVFTGISHRVHASLVNGRIVVRDGRLVGMDEEEIARRAHTLSFAMLRCAGVALPWGEPPWLDPR